MSDGLLSKRTVTRNRDLKDVPQARKLERTGENTFVIHAEGGNRYEGTYDPKKSAPLKGFKSSAVSVNGVCLRDCKGRNLHCNMCFHFSEYEPNDARRT